MTKSELIKILVLLDDDDEITAFIRYDSEENIDGDDHVLSGYALFGSVVTGRKRLVLTPEEFGD